MARDHQHQDRGAHDHFHSGEVDWEDLAHQQTRSLPLVDAWWGLLGRPVGKRLADVGCGPGVLSARYAALGADVLAVDLRDDALRHVPRRPRIRTLRHDLDAGPLPERVDVVVLTDVLHHSRDPLAMLRNARMSAERILVAEYEPGTHAGPPREARLSSKEVGPLLRKAGFAPQPPVRTAPGQYAIVANGPPE